MLAFWWLGPNSSRNFGDQLNTFLLHKLGQDFSWAPAPEAELIMIGSILHHLPEHWAGTVCGAGKLREHDRIDLSDARVFALRGHLTLGGVSGIKDPERVVLGDPGLLLPRWIRQPPPKYPLGVLPHWSDDELYSRFPYGHLIDPTLPCDEVVREIAACKRLVTSSLHGAVIADAYDIPRQIELYPHANSQWEGGDFKFRDYCSVYDEHPHFGEMHQVPRHRVKEIQDELLAALRIAVGFDLPEPALRLHPQMSILVPFRDDGEHRSRCWRWLRQYWRARGLDAEIIQGHDDGSPFAKSVAINQAASMARGNIFVVLDADAYMIPGALTYCADRIQAALANNKHLWYMPYNGLFRLNEETTLELLQTSPEGPAINQPPDPSQCEPQPGGPYEGHQYGAMAMVLPREAFYAVNGFDPNFCGWGGEDVSFLRALDTIWGHHEVAKNQILHFWHEKIGSQLNDRRWVGQVWGSANSRLAQRYSHAIGETDYMKALIDEHPLELPRFFK